MAATGRAPEAPAPVRLLWEALPPPPPEPLDAYLDAAARCFARHGVGRTSLPDIARELGVSRTTVYRRAGSIEGLASLLLARELHVLLATLPDIVDSVQSPRTLAHLLAGVVQFFREHPVLAKVLDDEPELIGGFLVQQLPSVIEQVRVAAEPLLTVAMEVGLIRRCDASGLAELLVRTLVTCIIAPPASDVRAFLEQTLVPLLEP